MPHAVNCGLCVKGSHSQPTSVIQLCDLCVDHSVVKCSQQSTNWAMVSRLLGELVIGDQVTGVLVNDG